MHFPLNQTPLFSLLHIVFKDSLKISPKKKKKALNRNELIKKYYLLMKLLPVNLSLQNK